jgi:RNA polymerase sigma factor (sigma-70 family)
MDTDQWPIDTFLALATQYSHKLAHDPQDAEDLAQTTLLKAFCGWKREYAELNDAQLRRWLYQIALHAWSDLTRRKRHATEELSDGQIASGDVEASVVVNVTLSQLPEEQRALLLWQSQGYTYGEMATRLNTTCYSVNYRLREAKRVFREEWAA